MSVKSKSSYLRDNCYEDVAEIYTNACKDYCSPIDTYFLKQLKCGSPLARIPSTESSPHGFLEESSCYCYAAALKENHPFRTLAITNFSNHFINKVQDFENVISVIFSSLQLQYGKILELDLSDCQLNEEMSSIIAKQMGFNRTGLRSINLSKNRIGIKGIMALINTFQNPENTIIECSISFNELPTSAGMILSDYIRSVPLEKDLLSHVGSSEDFKVNSGLGGRKAEKLSFSSLKHLHGAFNDFGDDVAIAISEALTHNRTLRTLDLSGNHIGDIGAKALFFSLKQVSSSVLGGIPMGLTCLNLRHNHIGNKVLQQFGDFLRFPSSITQLFLGKMKPQPSTAATIKFLSALMCNTTLQLLDITGWSIPVESSISILKSLFHNNSSLRALLIDEQEEIMENVKIWNESRMKTLGWHSIYVGSRDQLALEACLTVRISENVKESIRFSASSPCSQGSKQREASRRCSEVRSKTFSNQMNHSLDSGSKSVVEASSSRVDIPSVDSMMSDGYFHQTKTIELGLTNEKTPNSSLSSKLEEAFTTSKSRSFDSAELLTHGLFNTLQISDCMNQLEDCLRDEGVAIPSVKRLVSICETILSRVDQLVTNSIRNSKEKCPKCTVSRFKSNESESEGKISDVVTHYQPYSQQRLIDDSEMHNIGTKKICDVVSGPFEEENQKLANKATESFPNANNPINVSCGLSEYCQNCHQPFTNSLSSASTRIHRYVDNTPVPLIGTGTDPLPIRKISPKSFVL